MLYVDFEVEVAWKKLSISMKQDNGNHNKMVQDGLRVHPDRFWIDENMLSTCPQKHPMFSKLAPPPKKKKNKSALFSKCKKIAKRANPIHEQF